MGAGWIWGRENVKWGDFPGYVGTVAPKSASLGRLSTVLDLLKLRPARRLCRLLSLSRSE